MSSRSSLRTPKKSTVAFIPSIATTLPGTPGHMFPSPPGSRGGRVGDDRLAERDPAVTGGHLAMWIYLELPRKLAQDPLGEPRVLEAPARQHHRQPPRPARRAADQLGARRRERGVEAGGDPPGRLAADDVPGEGAPERAEVEAVEPVRDRDVERVGLRPPRRGGVERGGDLPP